MLFLKIGINTYFLITIFSNLFDFIMRVVLLIALFLSCKFAAPAQNVSVTRSVTDTTAINRLLVKADKILNPDSAIVLFNEVIQQSSNVNYGEGAFRGLMTKGIKYFEKEDYIQYRNTTIEALKWADKSVKKDAKAWCYTNIGESYFDEGDYIRASEYYYTALQEQMKALGDAPTHSAANIYNCLGKVNMRLNQPEKAMAFFNMAQDISQSGKLYYQLAEAYINKGEYYTSIHKIDSSEKYFLGVLEIGKRIGKPDLVAMGNCDLGKGFIDAGAFEEAVNYLQSAIQTASNKFPYIVVDASYSLGDAWYHLHKYKEAETKLEAALHEVIEHNYKDYYIKCYTKLIEVYDATRQYKKAMEYMATVAVLKDSLMSSDKAKEINLMELKFQTVEKDKQIAQGQLLIAQQNSKLVRKNIWILSIGGGVLLLLLAALGMYRTTLHKQRLQAEQIKSLEQENKIGILKAAVQGEDNERGRIARELHDGIGGMLSAAMMRFSAMHHDDKLITQVPAYKEAMDILEEMGDEIRKTAHNLMPDVLLKQNLQDAVRSYCNAMQEGGTLQIDFQNYGSFDDLNEDFKLNVYRIVQELLKNVMQHANASHVFVQLLSAENILTVTVEDNGVGFNTNEVKNGLGLLNLRTRVSSLDGNFALESEPGKGTSVFIEFNPPLNSSL